MAAKLGPQLQGLELSECNLPDLALYELASRITSNLKVLDLSGTVEFGS